MSESISDYRESTAVEYRKRIDRVLRHIREHRGVAFSLEELARVAHFSPFHFHRIFAAYMGETVGEYIRRTRLEQAALELLGGRAAVADIALDTGYDTHAAFAKAFKKHFGISPSAYREERGAGPGEIATPKPHRPRRRRGSMQPEIRELPQRTVHCVTRKGLIDGNFNAAASEAFAVLG
jgi:AraC family transcriptional regulator